MMKTALKARPSSARRFTILPPQQRWVSLVLFATEGGVQ